MALKNRIYMITFKAGDHHVSRHPVEDCSSKPKPVFALPDAVHEQGMWIVKKSEEGYKLKNGGALTGVWEGRIFAFVIEGNGGPPEEWVITAQPQHGDNIYMVEKADRSAEWVVGGEDHCRGYPIEVKPLIVHPTFPPKYPGMELFAFI